MFQIRLNSVVSFYGNRTSARRKSGTSFVAPPCGSFEGLRVAGLVQWSASCSLERADTVLYYPDGVSHGQFLPVLTAG